MKWFWLALCMVGLSACEPLDLERPGIPLQYGLRYDEPTSGTEWTRNVTTNDLEAPLLVEIPLVADSNGLPAIPPNNYLPLQENSTPLDLVFSSLVDTLLFPPSQASLPSGWADSLTARVGTFVAALKRPPGRIVLGINWRKVPDLQVQLQRIESEWSFEGIPLAFSFLASDPPEGSWRYGDFLAVAYPSLNEPKRECIVLNPKIAELATIKPARPVFIYQSNVIGLDKTDQLRNLLRFWPAETEIEGLVLNSIYDRHPGRDSVSYFGFANDTAFTAFLESYQSR